ncbi:putative nuclease HARBI1 isoform X2 [Lytechinus variegatus]|uniref:putative nuclease HARBI1 isoform X2 n=1 Tax=Lytechinus variegatus TaxID=7654 RepID=UPI001BB299EC|nr:putative nuclease HARBI1 isoform X2 [Lytechinus variegatus]XP_041467028.1 putative nuclease HARBI1 isoform X2 [Lytechinus variegatus]XP_041469108.1 putative nuclease HARBI1 isoform X2 [Lytechinus variegatus]
MARNFEQLRRVEREREIQQHIGRPERGLRDRKNPFECYEDEPFRERYRFSKETAMYIINMLEGDLERQTDRNDPLPVMLQVLTGLRFYAVGTFQKMHADEATVSQSSVCRIIKDVSEAIARRKRQFMKFPTTRDEIETTQRQFYDYCGFPGVIGAIDGTHVYIRSPGGEQALYFLNRKNRYSVNVQVVCDVAGKITNIVARWPGSTHDSRIFSEWLLGDSGYPCLPFLLTPLLNPLGRPQVRYNSAHKRGRCVIERTFGRWKRRFPCLNDLRVKVDTTFTIIVACSVLWNISLDHNEVDIPGPEPEEMPPLVHLPPGLHDAVAGRLRREQIIEDHFSN